MTHEMVSATIRRSFYTRDVFRSLVSYLKGDCLDVGAGMSRYKSMLLQQVTSYTTMDIEAFPGIDVVGDALRPPFPDASFDSIISMHVLEHVKEPWVMIEQIKRMLRPGGIAIICAPFMYPYHADPHDYFRFSEEGIRHLFERVQMNVLVASKYCGWMGLQSEIFKQKYVSPYKKPHPWWKRRLMSLLETLVAFITPYIPLGITYANVVCVAQKPLS